VAGRGAAVRCCSDRARRLGKRVTAFMHAPFLWQRRESTMIAPPVLVIITKRGDKGSAMGRNEQSFLMEIAGPKIEVPDLLKFETARNHSLSNTIMSRLKDLEREYNELVALQQWNQFVEEFKINTQVRLNQNYYLYESGDRKFLSLLSPEELGSSYTFHGKTRLHSEGFFVKVDEEKSVAKPA
jgi:hypothetical protein